MLQVVVAIIEELKSVMKVSYYHWEKVDGKSYPEKRLNEISGNDAYLNLTDNCFKFKLHYYIKKSAGFLQRRY